MTYPTRPTPGSARLRIGRHSEPGRIYLVTFHTVGRKPIFLDWTHACIMARASTSPMTLRSSRLLCWVLMPDHWHGLVEVGEMDELSLVVRRIKGISARAVPRNRSGGSLWAPGFHDRALRKDENLRSMARYVVTNPMRAGLVDNIGLYPFWDAAWMDGARRD